MRNQDSVSYPYEFKRVGEYDWKTVPLTGNPPARFTDDTVMTLAIKKAIIEGLDLTETMVTVGRRYPEVTAAVSHNHPEGILEKCLDEYMLEILKKDP